MTHVIQVLRVYEWTPEIEGERMLVDRLWPRGIRKEKLMPFVWKKEIAPSADLRKWFGHQPERFEEFVERYRKELDENAEAQAFVEEVRMSLQSQDVLLLYGAKDKAHNQALVLKAWLEERLA